MKPSHTKSIIFLCALCIGALIQYPFLNFQVKLAQGDHGLNLYAIEAVLNGQKPYRDFHWFYSPFMLYFYAFFFLVFKSSVLTILHAVAFIKIATGMLIYATLALYFTPILSLIGAMWFWIFSSDFTYTYNHTGGWLLSMFSFLFLVSYLKTSQIKNLYFALCGTMILCLIKLNFGISTLAGILASVAFIDLILKRPVDKNKKYFYFYSFIGFPAILSLLHVYFLWNIPFYNIRQCFQYFGTDAYKGTYPSIFETIFTSFRNHFTMLTRHPINLLLDISLLVIFLTLVIQYLRNKDKRKNILPVFLLLFACFTFYLLNLHEYLLSAVRFRGFWAEPFKYILIFILLGWAVEFIHKKRHLIVYVTLLAVPLTTYMTNIQATEAIKTPTQFLPHKKAGVYTTNSPYWTATVLQTTAFLKEHMTEKELFLVVPYAPIYYFLMDKPSPVRQLAFFDFQNITKEEQQRTIREIETKNVNWLITTSRVIGDAAGLGRFGKSNSLRLKQYLDDHFEFVIQFGKWDTNGGWIDPHGTKIYRRIK